MRGARAIVPLVALACACSSDAPPAQPAKPATPAAPSSDANAEASATVVPEQEYTYDPTNKRDPFRSFVRTAHQQEEGGTESPLERFDLTQLELSAIIWGIDSPRALIVDPSGKGYIVSTGQVIGKNKGRIVSIGDNVVVVKETYVDSFDRATTKPVEMRLRNTEGG